MSDDGLTKSQRKRQARRERAEAYIAETDRQVAAEADARDLELAAITAAYQLMLTAAALTQKCLALLNESVEHWTHENPEIAMSIMAARGAAAGRVSMAVGALGHLPNRAAIPAELAWYGDTLDALRDAAATVADGDPVKTAFAAAVDQLSAALSDALVDDVDTALSGDQS